jgi:hypothetical protein
MRVAPHLAMQPNQNRAKEKPTPPFPPKKLEGTSSTRCWNGAGAYVVAKENLGTNASLFAAAALALDYLLNVAVAISAGVGALVSAVPSLLPHTLALCLVVLAVLTLVNLRGVRATGAVFIFPTFFFLGTLPAPRGRPTSCSTDTRPR